MNILNNFLNYVKFDTTSDPNSNLHPSNKDEFLLAKYLKQQLNDLGLEVILDDKCYLYTFISGNKNKEPIGFISHLDTSSDAKGCNIVPNIINNYDGLDIVLNKKENIILKVEEFPHLKDLKGKTLVTTNGKTLLGADDKSGIAIIMQMIYEILNSKIDHPDIYICFTPDEEIGEGSNNFNFDIFKAKYAYTIDGSRPNEISYENFNAADIIVNANGKSIHPGDAKGKLINASLLLLQFHEMLPKNLDPALTEKKEGFNHLISINGGVEHATSSYIVRNHDKILFNNQKNTFIKIKEYLNDFYGYDAIFLQISDTYYNMKDLFIGNEYIIDLAINAIKNNNLTPIVEPIRGGTDGARLSYNGLLCPNLGTGGYNFHGPYEFLCLEEMESVVKILIDIIKNAK